VKRRRRYPEAFVVLALGCAISGFLAWQPDTGAVGARSAGVLICLALSGLLAWLLLRERS